MSNDYRVTLTGNPEDTAEGVFINAFCWDYSSKLLNDESVRRMDAARELQKQTNRVVHLRLPALKPGEDIKKA